MSYLYNDLVGFKGNSIDAFGRLKVSSPFTLFDSQNRYQENDKWSTVTATGGTTSVNTNESVVNMRIGLTGGSKVFRETKRVFSYQPGKSLLVFNTFAMNQPIENLRQRVGYFGEDNGVYFEREGMTAYITLRSKVSGTADSTTRRIAQSSWNGDTFNGNGSSGVVLGATAANIFWLDIEWLGVGDVRTGFVYDGRPVVAHTFKNANLNPTTYMTTASLPCRYEIESLDGGLTGYPVGTTGATMKAICSSVMSEAGFEGFSRRYNVSTGMTAQNVPTNSLHPIITLRLNSNRLDGVVVPSNVNLVLVDTSNNNGVKTAGLAQYRVLLNAGLSGPNWKTHYNGQVDYDLDATNVTGGTDIIGGYCDTQAAIMVNDVNDFNFQLGRTQRSITGATGTSDTITIALQSFQTNTGVVADMSWFEII
jgi:hypothetical protein